MTGRPRLVRLTAPQVRALLLAAGGEIESIGRPSPALEAAYDALRAASTPAPPARFRPSFRSLELAEVALDNAAAACSSTRATGDLARLAREYRQAERDVIRWRRQEYGR